jgi:hypothetical protein
MTKYEREIINPILKTIECNQEFLTQLENIPQLAKLGFMFERFYTAGRVSYGYDGIVKKGSSCENNPKYEIQDNIKYLNETIENIVYDSWGMHVSNEPDLMTFDEIKNLILNGKTLSEFEIKYRKPNKTFDEWVEVLCDKRFRYHSLYPDRRRVADHLLCTIGNGYGYSPTTGMVFCEAGGADQDQDIYGNWENATFDPTIKPIVDKILDNPMTKIAVDSYNNLIKEYREKERAKKWQSHLEYYQMLLDGLNKVLTERNRPTVTLESEEFEKFYDEYINESFKERMDDKPFEYYPICNYSIITKFDENTHPSYIAAGLEICEYIVNNPPVIKKDFNEYQIQNRNEIISFSENFIKRFK